MLWRVLPLSLTRKYNVSVLLQTAKRTTQYSPCNIRGITTTRPFLAVQTGDDTSTEHKDKRQEDNDPSSLKITYTPKTVPEKPPQRKLTHIRCVQLLTPPVNESGAKATKSFADQVVCVSGTIKTIRKQKRGAFAHVTDGSCLQPIQVVLEPELAAP